MSLPSEYMPSWYIRPSQLTFYSSIKKAFYYRKEGFPYIYNQAEWDGVYDAESLGYDNTVWWGKRLFNNSNCVAYAVSCCMQIFNFLKTGDKDSFSVIWLHGNQSGGGSGFKKDGGRGAYVEEVLNKMITDGAVRYSLVYPYMCKYSQLQYDSEPIGYTGIGTSKGFVQAHYNDLIGKANQYRLASWTQLDKHNPELIKEIIMQYGCALINVQMTTDLEDNVANANNGTIKDQYYDYGDLTHVMTIIGWKEINGVLHWTCVNHWGNWGYTEDGDTNRRCGLCFIPYSYSKILQVWKLVPNINGTFTWDFDKVQGGNFIFTHREWNRLLKRIEYKCKQKGISNISSVRWLDETFRAYDYNCAVQDLKALNSNFTLSNVRTGDAISAKHLNDLVYAINSI